MSESLYYLSPEERRYRMKRKYGKPPSKKRDKLAWFAWWRKRLERKAAEEGGENDN